MSFSPVQLCGNEDSISKDPQMFVVPYIGIAHGILLRKKMRYATIIAVSNGLPAASAWNSLMME